MLSAMQPVLETPKVDARKKIAIYKVYDYLKGNTDMVDQQTKFYTSKAKSRRRAMTGFGYMQDVAPFNKTLEPRSQISFEFEMTLA